MQFVLSNDKAFATLNTVYFVLISCLTRRKCQSEYFFDDIVMLGCLFVGFRAFKLAFYCE